ncbi:MAG: hypothetical protein IJ777_00890 [Clostridia bacterium]|nr:hypothetical protein [Clostridia bacterium]
MQQIKVKQILITKQGKSSYNFQEFLKIVNEKQIPIRKVTAGDSIAIEKDVTIKILFPTEDLIRENVLNNNSMVAKISYLNFSMLLTGDIEKIAENKLVSMYQNTNALQANILKVAHHGSKTASTQAILDLINPQIALIGVGKNNKFGHPNQEVIERLTSLRHKNLQDRQNGRNHPNH